MEKSLFVSSGASSNFPSGIHSHNTTNNPSKVLACPRVFCQLDATRITEEQRPLNLLILKRPAKWFELRVAMSRLERPCVIFSAG